MKNISMGKAALPLLAAGSGQALDAARLIHRTVAVAVETREL
jgi:hypothetical protein